MFTKAIRQYRAAACVWDNLLCREQTIIDHPRSGVVFRSCASVCTYVCQTITFKSLDVGSSFSYFIHPVYLQGIRVKFVYEGHRVNLKGKGKMVQNSYSRNVKLLAKLWFYKTHSHKVCLGFSATTDRLVWPPYSSRDRKLPCVTKCTCSQVVCLRL